MDAIDIIEDTERKAKTVSKKSFPVTGMTCAACASSVESMLGHTEGVYNASVNFANSTVLVEYDCAMDLSDLQNAVRQIGYDIVVDAEDPTEVQEELSKKHYVSIKRRTLWSAILTLPIFVLGMFFMDWVPGRWISLVLAVPILFWFGRSFFINASVHPAKPCSAPY